MGRGLMGGGNGWKDKKGMNEWEGGGGGGMGNGLE